MAATGSEREGRMPEGVELPGADPDELTSIAFRLRDKPDASLLTHEADGVFGPVVCLTWEEARHYAVLEHDYDTEPFEVSRERLATLSVAFGFNGIHIFRVQEGKTYRRPEPFK
jgi:hypothetical protein